ncbi:hypothetical protein [Paenibacillus agricola]|uniref:Uncharacterized protein n=1 Tax=Paenibacillus agricola TaxID=2716264 RepID=A0ABX0JL88_9BACL|nr:hypothetical protein [Paenibacillus agricola]NHN34770.1 hypothetical protein [Paenibacillus agricola]
MSKIVTKGIKMTEERMALVNARIAASGLEADEYLESLMALETMKDLQKRNPTASHTLREIEKLVNRIYHATARIYEEGENSVDDLKGQSAAFAMEREAEREAARQENKILLKKLAQKDEELAVANKQANEYRLQAEQAAKAGTALEELARLSKDKAAQLEAQLGVLQAAAGEAAALREHLLFSENKRKENMEQHQEAERLLREEASELRREAARSQQAAQEAEARYHHQSEFQLKQKEMESRELLLKEKEEWQEKLAAANEQHATRLAQLIDRLSRPVVEDLNMQTPKI